MIIPGSFRIEIIYRMMMDYLDETPADQWPDGLFCISDKTTYGVISALKSHGLRVPQDMNRWPGARDVRL